MPRLVVVTTGGTIATEAGADGALRPARSGADLATGLDPGLDIEVVDLLSLDSSALAPADWLTIAAAVESAAQRADGIVITHGTDTLEETSLWLDLTYPGDVPVVLTAAARPADDPDPDGPGNLRDALTVAASPLSHGLGVLISFAGVVRIPLGTNKIGGDAVFGGVGPLGAVHGAEFTVAGARQRPFLGANVETPRVDIVAGYPGADGTAVDAFTAAGARGLVLEAMGAGNAGPPLVRAVERACAGGLPVVVTTRVPQGSATAGYGPGHDLVAAGAMMAPRLRASQARVLLMAALGAGLPVAEVITRWG